MATINQIIIAAVIVPSLGVTYTVGEDSVVGISRITINGGIAHVDRIRVEMECGSFMEFDEQGSVVITATVH